MFMWDLPSESLECSRIKTSLVFLSATARRRQFVPIPHIISSCARVDYIISTPARSPHFPPSALHNSRWIRIRTQSIFLPWRKYTKRNSSPERPSQMRLGGPAAVATSVELRISFAESLQFRMLECCVQLVPPTRKTYLVQIEQYSVADDQRSGRRVIIIKPTPRA